MPAGRAGNSLVVIRLNCYVYIHAEFPHELGEETTVNDNKYVLPALLSAAVLAGCQSTSQPEKLGLTTDLFPGTSVGEVKKFTDSNDIETQYLNAHRGGRIASVAYRRMPARFVFGIESDPLKEEYLRSWKWMKDKEIVFGRQFEFRSPFGRMRIKRFTTTGRNCAFFRKQFETTNDNMARKRKSIEGYICETPRESLPDATVAKFLDGISVKRGEAPTTPRQIASKAELPRIERRSLVFTWEGVSDKMAGRIEIEGSMKSGVMSVNWPNSDDTCEGTYALTSEAGGGWSVSCTNGKTASGDYRYVDDGKVEGTGKDQDGKAVRFRLGQVS